MKLFECVPNFSDGKDQDVIRAVVAAAESVEGIAILDIESNADHNRSVLTFVGEGEAVVEAAFRATRVAVARIDLNHHKGEHPRMGAMDVIPFIPLGEATMDEAVALARRFGARTAQELKVPVYYYGAAATRPERVDLPKVREGQFEGIRQAISTDPARAPDEGERQVHPTAGAAAVGARPILVAYNVYLTTPDVAVAKKIARSIRGRDGGLAEVRALGFEIKERNRAQVSMNMTDHRRTPLHRAFDLIQREAQRYGVGVEESEIVGLVPEDALFDAADHYLQLNHFDRHLLLERRVREKLAAKGSSPGAKAATPSASLGGGTVEGFLGALAGRTATPGGGSASALSGAMGCALAEMVLRYTAPAGNLPEDITAVVGDLAGLRAQLLRGIDDDARSYDAVRAAKAARKAAPQDPAAAKGYLDALHGAARVPLETAEACVKAAGLLASMRARIKPIFLSDVVTAEALLRAGRAGAVANAEINLASLKEANAPSEDIGRRLGALGTIG